jgi:REP element-mobilizing transposase RayT
MFTPEDRATTKGAILFWHQDKWLVHALTVMPDHVHILATPLEAQRGEWYPLSEILHSVKRFSSRRINARHGRRGTLWQPERFDRISRNGHEFEEKFDYILYNAVKRGLCEDPFAYDGFWYEGMTVEAAEHPRRRALPGRRAPERIPADVLTEKRRDLPHWERGGSTYFITFDAVGRR